MHKSRERRATYPRIAGESNQRLVCIQSLEQASNSEVWETAGDKEGEVGRL